MSGRWKVINPEAERSTKNNYLYTISPATGRDCWNLLQTDNLTHCVVMCCWFTSQFQRQHWLPTLRIILVYFQKVNRWSFIYASLKTNTGGAVLRWQRNRTGRPLSPPQIHQKNIWTLSKFHKTTSGCLQRTSGTQKSSPLSSKGGRKKYKR